MLIGEQDEEGGTHRDGRHQVRQKRHGVDVVGPFAPPVFGDGVTDQGTDGAGQQSAGHADQDRSLEGVPDRIVIEDALLTVHAVFRDVLTGKPPLGGEVCRVPGVQEGIVAGVRQEGLKGKGDDGENAGKECDHYQYQGDDVLPHFAQIDLGGLAGLACDGGIVLPAVEGHLVEQHDRHAENHHDDGQNAGLTGVLGVQGDILGGKGGQAQIVGHGIRAHGAAEHQQNGGQNGGLDHRQRDLAHGLPLGGVQDRGCLLYTSQDCYICGNYKKRTHDCTAHFIRTDLLTAGVLSNLRKVTSYAAKHEKQFIKLLIEQNEDGGKRRNAAKRKELDAPEKRISELSAIFKRLYEDSVSGRISDERFTELSADYEAEQQELKERAARIQAELSKAQAATVNAEKFMNIVRKHMNFEELTHTLLREFVEKIVVHECSYDENGTRRQDIEIYYSFVGKVDLPE